MVLRSARELQGCRVHATDGEIGSLYEFYFEDQHWTGRYLAVDVGEWLTGRRVLIAPTAIINVGWAGQNLRVNLTKIHVRDSPDAGTDKPVSRQQEEVLKPDSRPSSEDPHLRRTREVIGYYIAASDGDIGHVEDFLFDDEHWTIHYMVVDTHNWWLGKKVLITPQQITAVNWSEGRVYINLTRDDVRTSPPYDAAMLINCE